MVFWWFVLLLPAQILLPPIKTVVSTIWQPKQCCQHHIHVDWGFINITYPYPKSTLKKTMQIVLVAQSDSNIQRTGRFLLQTQKRFFVFILADLYSGLVHKLHCNHYPKCNFCGNITKSVNRMLTQARDGTLWPVMDINNQTQSHKSQQSEDSSARPAVSDRCWGGTYSLYFIKGRFSGWVGLGIR